MRHNTVLDRGRPLSSAPTSRRGAPPSLPYAFVTLFVGAPGLFPSPFPSTSAFLPTPPPSAHVARLLRGASTDHAVGANGELADVRGDDDGHAPPDRGFLPGRAEGHAIVETYGPIPAGGLEEVNADVFDARERPHLYTSANATVPLALMCFDPASYPTASRARKACRKGTILLQRAGSGEVFDGPSSRTARAIDRVFPNDILAKQTRMSGGFYPDLIHQKAPFDIPVVYEDDHFAIVNKPAGVVTYSHRNGGHGRMSMKAGLPYFLRPPSPGTSTILRRPQPVHRLDRPTSGLLIAAKTRPAVAALTEQFVGRRVRKTYTAILHGLPFEPNDARLSAEEARATGADVEGEGGWQLVDRPLDEKSATTLWRVLEYARSLKAAEGYLALVEMKPRTGRYHQLRRHMAEEVGCAMIGDVVYDGGSEAAMNFRRNGLFLCSNRLALEHPYYNSEEGRAEWRKRRARGEKMAYIGGQLLKEEADGTVYVRAEIDLPEKFRVLLEREQQRFDHLSSDHS